MERLEISERQVENVTILDMKGSVSIGENCELFRLTIRWKVRENKKNLLLNMANVRYIDSSGLGEIVSAFMALNREGGSLKMSNLNSRVLDLISITKLLTVFDSFETERDAVASFREAAVARMT
ncbi:MAG: STAS domain-containing protein [Acidobacteriota bacterium]